MAGYKGELSSMVMAGGRSGHDPPPPQNMQKVLSSLMSPPGILS